ncbi:MAG TPA: sulfatase-like hydrolase/transferase [Gemmatimonadaceae bacterium]|nr:sulfatase-like hydrolase/transferase [Gemmatimonadaceae bacterium]
MASTVSPALPFADATAGLRTRLGRFALAAMLVVVLMVVAVVTRLALLAYAWRELDASLYEVLKALLVGEVFDVLASLWVVAPLVVVLALLPDRWFSSRVVRGWTRGWLFFLFALSAFVIAAEVIFFDEFNGRFNFVAVDYLIFPTEVVTNLWESYPLPAILLGVAAVGALGVWLTRRRIARALEAATPARSRLAVVGAHAATLGALTFGVAPEMGKVSDDRALNEIALNGYYTFWMAFMGQDAPYEGLYATRPVAEESARIRSLVVGDSVALGGAAWSPDRPTERRVVSAVPESRRNVVVVLEESLGSIFLASLHPRGDTVLTPRFDSLIAEGTVLANAYSTGNRTIRALEATTSSLPPLPGISIVRRPASQGLFTLPSVLKERGYNTSFIYGGRAMFDGMGSYMRNNGMELIVEQKDYPKDAFTNAWGAADEYIFDKALAVYDSLHAAQRPFYSLVLSVSNHKPYSFPAGRIAADPNARKRTNAVMYADWALGRFMRMAATHPWFDSTLFVLMGDHGARVYGASEIPLPSYEVPILFYAPRFIPAGQRINTLASTMDLPATIMARLGMTYESKWFGQDVFSVRPERGRALMTHNSNIALMQGDRIAVLGLKGATELYEYDRPAKRLRRVASPDSAGRELVEDAIAYFHTADRLYRSGAYGTYGAAAKR